ncbi:MAG: hypothetical protein KKG76_04555 [Euryarchaeota archaeon]|nr:hypothetical protein [Euryarchaeota archaeon]
MLHELVRSIVLGFLQIHDRGHKDLPSGSPLNLPGSCRDTLFCTDVCCNTTSFKFGTPPHHWNIRIDVFVNDSR